MSHGAHRTDQSYVVSLVEDFCRSPNAPVGYMISQKLTVSQRVCETVHGVQTPVLNMQSRISSVTGDEAGVGGGVVSGTNVGLCRPVKMCAATVRAEGDFVLRHGTLMEMNCSSPDSPGNTIGKIIYQSSAAPPQQETDDPSKYFVDVDANDLLNFLGFLVNLPVAALLKGVSLVFPEFGEFLANNLAQTTFGTGDKSGVGAIFGNNDGTNGKLPEEGGQCGPFAPGILGIAMGLAHAEGIWGDEVEFENGQKAHDSKVNPHGGSNSIMSALETMGQGFGILARHLGFSKQFCALVRACFGDPNGYGFVQGVFNGAHQVP